ncbi:MAG: biotin/lipoyl-binding protein, partial [Anaerolineae bacterium]
MRTLIRVVGLLLLVAAIAAGAYWFIQNRSASQAAAQTSEFTQVVAVREGNIDASISVVGELYAPQNETLRFERLGDTTNLLTLEVAPGNVVQAGQTLATIDSKTYQQALDQAQSDLQDS